MNDNATKTICADLNIIKQADHTASQLRALRVKKPAPSVETALSAEVSPSLAAS